MTDRHPKTITRIPRLSLHKGTGQARAKFRGRDHYFGRYGSPEAHRRYAQWISEITADQGEVPVLVRARAGQDADGIALGVPDWVAYELRRDERPAGGKSHKRPSRWSTDPELHQRGIAPDDSSYRHSGYSRGHMCMKSHAARMGAAADRETHTVLNACPQMQRMNGGIWLAIENLTGRWANEQGAVWIVTGPVFTEASRTWIGDAGEVGLEIAGRVEVSNRASRGLVRLIGSSGERSRTSSCRHGSDEAGEGARAVDARPRRHFGKSSRTFALVQEKSPDRSGCRVLGDHQFTRLASVNERVVGARKPAPTRGRDGLGCCLRAVVSESFRGRRPMPRSEGRDQRR